MKSLFLKLFIFIIPLLLLLFVLDYTLSYYLKKSNSVVGEYEVWTDIYNSNIDADMEIMGSSRSWIHIDPQILSDSLSLSAYNFGMDGQNFWIQYFRHKEFITHNQQPKYILWSADVFALSREEGLFNSDQFLPYMLYNFNIYKHTKVYIGYSFWDYVLPLIRYGGRIKAIRASLKVCFHKNRVNKVRKKGFAPQYRQWNSDFEKAKEANILYKVELNTETIALFEQFIRECNNAGIKLILVYTPEYIEGQQYVVNRDEIFKLYRYYSTQYNIPFLDYSNDSICLDKTFFYNAEHLNAKGAETFSKKLASDLKSIIPQK
jgi:hypothetical protein